MINLLIDYFLNQPTPTTAPLKVALTKSNLLTALGGSDVVVNLVDTRDQEGNPPYVRIYDSGIRKLEATFLGGSYQELQYMVVECAAYGGTPTQASIRSEDLKRAVRGVMQTQAQNFFSSMSNSQTDLAGSNATDSITNVFVVGGDGDPVIKGPGTDSTNPKWTSQTSFRVAIRVFFERARAS